MVLREDINQVKFLSIWQLSPMMPMYHRTLFKYSKALFIAMYRKDLAEDLDQQLIKIAEKMGTNIGFVYWIFENMPALNSFTKSKNPKYSEGYIYKYTMAEWFNEIEDWVFEALIQIEPQIRFTQLKPMN